MASSSQPRKFSEKIAILKRQEAEGKSEFDQVMNDVQVVKNQVTHQASRMDGMGPHQPQWPRPGSSGGSLPNVPRMMANYTELPPGQFPWPVGPHWGQVPMMEPMGAPRVIHPSRERSPGSQHGAHPYHNPYRPLSPHAVSPHRPRSSERIQASQLHHSAAPNPVGPHLDIPQNQDWRRTHSDPSIHHSAVSPAGQPLSPMNPNTPPQLRSSPTDESSNTDNSQGPSIYLEPKERGGRPSSCDGAPGGVGGGGTPTGQTGLPVPPHSFGTTGSLPDLPSSLPGHGGGGYAHHPSYPQLPPNHADPSAACPNSTASLHQQRHSIQLPVNGPFGQIQQQQQHSPNSPGNMQYYPNFTLDAGYAVSSQSQSAPNSPASPGQVDSPVPSPGTQAYNAVQAGINSLSFQAQEEMGGSPGGQWIIPQYQQQVYGSNQIFSQPNQYIPTSDAYGLNPQLGGSNIPEINVIDPRGINQSINVADHQISGQLLGLTENFTEMTQEEIQRLLVSSDQVDELAENRLRHETS